MINFDEMLNDLREKLKDRQLKVVADRVGIHYNSLYRFRCGDNNITVKTLKKIYNYLSKD